jgi:hypothetical protein
MFVESFRHLTKFDLCCVRLTWARYIRFVTVVLRTTLLAPRKVQCFFFSGEGPRSRRYRRTAAMRLLVQPCDEDGYFLSFS